MNLEYYRLKAKLSQSELAEKLDVTQGAISQWENRQTNPRTDMLIKIAKILCCTIDELLGNSESKIGGK